MNNYMKPDIAFQPMAMATSVSGSCSMDANQAEYQCPVHINGWGDLTVFPANSECALAPEPGVNDQFCYHVPNGDNSVFES